MGEIPGSTPRAPGEGRQRQQEDPAEGRARGLPKKEDRRAH